MQHVILTSVYAGPDAQFQLNILSEMVMRLMRYLLYYCDHKKRLFNLKCTRNRLAAGFRYGPISHRSETMRLKIEKKISTTPLFGAHIEGDPVGISQSSVLREN